MNYRLYIQLGVADKRMGKTNRFPFKQEEIMFTVMKATEEPGEISSK